MAGSFRHVVDDSGEFIGFDNLDNRGDFAEALEECIDMIEWLTKGDRLMIYNAWLDGHCKKRIPRRVQEEPGIFSFDKFWEP